MDKIKGLICEVYRGKTLGDCSLNGVSNRVRHVVLTGPGVPEIFEPRDDMPEVKLIVDGNNGHYFVDRRASDIVVRRMKAVPAEVGERWSSFGGAFIYSSDSRFPANSPIHIFDRVEG